MSGISPALPLTRDPGSPGYRLNKTMFEVIRQNFKNLVLTSPGERMMIPDFGAGIRNYLFQPNNSSTQSEIRSAIEVQVNKYMPFISIIAVDFSGEKNDMGDIGNSIQISISYEIVPLGTSDVLNVEL